MCQYCFDPNMLRIVLRDIPHFVLLVLNFGLHRIFSLIFSLLTHQLSFSLYPFSLIHVQGLKSLTSLTELDLSDNNISALPPELVRFRKSLYHPFLFILFGCVWVTLCSLFLGSLFFLFFFSPGSAWTKARGWDLMEIRWEVMPHFENLCFISLN